MAGEGPVRCWSRVGGSGSCRGEEGEGCLAVREGEECC